MKSDRQKSVAAHRGRRAGTAVCAQVYCIAGEYVTISEIAARIGVHSTTAGDRLRREQRKPGAVTWEGLES